MKEIEPPECPVCLQPYDAVSAVPRVLACGHTTCEACLRQLPSPFPNTIRCTVCTQLVKFMSSPCSLPKNLDLLHFSSLLQHRTQTKETRIGSPSSLPKTGNNRSILFASTLNSWPYEFYRKWKKWIIPEDCISIEKAGSDINGGAVYGKALKSFEIDYMVGRVLKEKEIVGLSKIGGFVERGENPKFFKPSYESRIVTVLFDLSEDQRTRVEVISSATHRVSNVGKTYGFWYSEDENCVYIVCEKFTSPYLKLVPKEKENEEEKLSTDEIRYLGILGMETCEILSNLHLERLVIGFLSANSLGFNDFDHVCIDLCEVLNSGRRMQRAPKVLEASLESNFLEEDLIFFSPEMLLHFVISDGLELGWGRSRYEVGSASDVWSVACLLVWLIVGKYFLEKMNEYLHLVVNGIVGKKGCDYAGLYMSWMDKIAPLLERRLSFECASLKETLCRCLSFDPGDRPVITELWRCLRELVIKPQFDTGFRLKQDLKKESSGHVVVLGELCHIVEESDKELIHDRADMESRVNDEGSERVSLDHSKCTEMKGHLNCITGLAIGGGFLFSSSYDKVVHVWSLQNFTQVHSFKGHEHRITSVVLVDGAQPLCISGDNEGVICIWEASFPFSQVPIKKLSETKDWRYSGIHSMAISGTEYLYTGSGDKLVKAWSLQDYTLSCAMSGHNSVVSSLIVSEGVLFSGSWDGTVRLWSLSDHGLLAVLGEDKLRNVASVLSLSVDRHLLFVAHENGIIKIWHNNVLVKSTETHKGAVFSVCKEGKWLLSGGWDKAINVQEICEDVDEMDVRAVGSIPCNSTVTALVLWDGKLFVGQADGMIKIMIFDC